MYINISNTVKSAYTGVEIKISEGFIFISSSYREYDKSESPA